MLLVRNKKTNSEFTLENRNMFNEACHYLDLEILQDNYVEQVIFDEIEVEEIIPKGNITSGDEVKYETNLKTHTVPSFRMNIEYFSIEDLNMFIKYDIRKTIKNEAKKELEKRS